jgi:hypothetical protein
MEKHTKNARKNNKKPQENNIEWGRKATPPWRPSLPPRPPAYRKSQEIYLKITKNSAKKFPKMLEEKPIK